MFSVSTAVVTCFVAHTASAACTRVSLASGPTVETHALVWYVVLCNHTLVTPTLTNSPDSTASSAAIVRRARWCDALG